MTKDEITMLKEQAKANVKALNSCPLHNFQREPPGVIGARYICQHCGGFATSGEAAMYKLGLLHGQQQANQST